MAVRIRRWYHPFLYALVGALLLYAALLRETIFSRRRSINPAWNGSPVPVFGTLEELYDARFRILDGRVLFRNRGVAELKKALPKCRIVR